MCNLHQSARWRKFRNCWSDVESFAKIASMERPNWVYWQDQGKWRAHPEGFPDREIQAASFGELQSKVSQLNRDITKFSTGITRLERPKAAITQAGLAQMDTPMYVLSHEQGKWRGHLENYPDSPVQGESFDEVQFKLYQLCRDLISGKTSNITRKVA
jgi:hypothetical protein